MTPKESWRVSEILLIFSDQGKQLEHLGRGRFRPPQNSRNHFHCIKLDCRQSKLHETKLPFKGPLLVASSDGQREVALEIKASGRGVFFFDKSWAQFQQSKDMMEATLLSQMNIPHLVDRFA